MVEQLELMKTVEDALDAQGATNQEKAELHRTLYKETLRLHTTAGAGTAMFDLPSRVGEAISKYRTREKAARANRDGFRS